MIITVTARNLTIDVGYGFNEESAEIRSQYLFFKRLFDIIFSVIGIILFALPMLVIAAVVRATSSGPAIFKQERLGLGGKKFTIFKFRSMRQNAEKVPVWAAENDSRVTNVGRILRKYHLDEMPQLFNIFKGDMSFVGPRPEREYFYKKFSGDLPDFYDRLKVKPGLTGLAQINGGYDITPKEKLALDKRYIEIMSIKNDFEIALKTLAVALKGKGAR